MIGLEYDGEIEQVIETKLNISSCVWKIPCFDRINSDSRPGLCLKSPMIPTVHPSIKWRLLMFPNGRSEMIQDKVDVYVQLFSSNGMVLKITIGAKFSLLNSMNSVFCEHIFADVKIKILPETEYRNPISFLPRLTGIENFVTRRMVMRKGNEILVNNCLRLSCEINSRDPIFTLNTLKEVRQLKRRLEEFDDFQKLLESEKFSDVKFMVGDKQICAHKAILASRSPVFRAMFDNDMQENQQNNVTIVDIRYEVLKELFRFIYAGTVSNIDRMACELLMTAEKYSVAGLKALCEKTLCSDLSVDNVLERLALADMYNSVLLKEQTMNFIVNNARVMVGKNDFVTLRPDLMFEVTRRMACKTSNP